MGKGPRVRGMELPFLFLLFSDCPLQPGWGDRQGKRLACAIQTGEKTAAVAVTAPNTSLWPLWQRLSWAVWVNWRQEVPGKPGETQHPIHKKR